MAVKTYRVQSTTTGNTGDIIESDQTAATRADGWTVAKIAAANSAHFDAGTKQTSGTFSLQSSTPKPSSFVTGALSNAFGTLTALSGTFANTAWTFTFAVRATTASAQAGRMRMRVFKSVNADGTSATELTGSTQVGTTSSVLSTTADVTSVVTWSPGTTINLDNEYLFFVLAWEITTAGGSNSADVQIRTGQAAAGSRLVTPDFVVPTPISIGKRTAATTVRGVALPVQIAVGKVGASTTSVGPAYDTAPTQTGVQQAWNNPGNASAADGLNAGISLTVGSISNFLVFDNLKTIGAGGTLGPAYDSAPTQGATSATDWVNLGNAAAADGNFATVTYAGAAFETLTFDNFGFSLPVGAVVTDVTVEAYVGGTSGNLSITPNAAGAIPQSPSIVPAMTLLTASGLWGKSSWTKAEIDGLSLAVTVNGIGTISLDYLRVTVSYVMMVPVTIPVGAVVSDVKVEVWGFAGVTDVTLQVLPAGITPTIPQNIPIMPIGTPGLMTLSGLWSHPTWTKTDVENVSFQLQVSNLAASSVTVDYLRVTFSYSVPSTVVRGITISEVTGDTLPIGRETSVTAVYGISLAPAGDAPITIGRKASVTSVKGISVAGTGAAPVTVGRVAGVAPAGQRDQIDAMDSSTGWSVFAVQYGPGFVYVTDEKIQGTGSLRFNGGDIVDKYGGFQKTLAAQDLTNTSAISFWVKTRYDSGYGTPNGRPLFVRLGTSASVYWEGTRAANTVTDGVWTLIEIPLADFVAVGGITAWNAITYIAFSWATPGGSATAWYDDVGFVRKSVAPGTSVARGITLVTPVGGPVGTVAKVTTVRGITLVPAPVAFAIGRRAAASTVKGVAIVPAPVSLPIGTRISATAVRGITLAPGLVSLSVGKRAVATTVRGVTLVPAPVAVLVGRKAAVSAVRGISLTPTGVALIAVGRITSAVFGPNEQMFTDSPVTNSGVTQELGTKFTVTADGIITAIRYWHAGQWAGEAYPLSIWRQSDGVKIASAVDTNPATGNWEQRQVALAVPLQVYAGQTYVVSWSNNGSYFYTNGSLTSMAAHLTNPVGVKGATGVMPTSLPNQELFGDVVYQPVAPKVYGITLAPTGAAPISIGARGSATSVKGISLAGAGDVGLAIGKIAVATVVRGIAIVPLVIAGPNSDTTPTEIASGQSWVNPANSATANQSFATLTPLSAGGFSKTIRFDNLGFSIPADATIKNIQAEIIGFQSVNDADWLLSALKAGAQAGSGANVRIPVTQTNLMPNGEFETNLVGWALQNGSESIGRDTFEKFSGNASLRLSCLTNGQCGVIGQFGGVGFPLTPAQIIDGNQISVTIKFKGTPGKSIGMGMNTGDDSASIPNRLFGGYKVMDSGWQYHTGTYNINPSDYTPGRESTRFMKLVVYVPASVAGDGFYIDSVYVTTGATPYSPAVRLQTTPGLFGTTWTPAEINASGFGFDLYAWGNAAPTNISLDTLRVYVGYTNPVPIYVVVGRCPSGTNVRGISLAPTGAVPVPVGTSASATVVKGISIAPTGAAPISVGKRTAATSVKGITLAPGVVTISIGRRVAATTVQGISLAGVTAFVPTGKVGGVTVVRGITVAAVAAKATPLLAATLTVGATMVVVKKLSRAVPAPMTLTPAQALVKKAPRTNAATLTLTPAVQRKISNSLAASLILSPAQTVKRVLYRPLAANLNFTGAVLFVKKAPSAIAATLVLTPAQSLRQFRKISFPLTLNLTSLMQGGKLKYQSLAANLILSPTMVKLSGNYKALAATLNLTPVMARFVQGKRVFSVSLSLAPLMVRRPNINWALNLPLISAFVKSKKNYQTLSAVLSHSAVLGKVRLAPRAFVASVALSAALTKVLKAPRTFNVGLNVVPGLNRVMKAYRRMDTTVTLTLEFLRPLKRLLPVNLPFTSTMRTGKAVTPIAFPATVNLKVEIKVEKRTIGGMLLSGMLAIANLLSSKSESVMLSTNSRATASSAASDTQLTSATLGASNVDSAD